ncbi:MAG TPA: class E sortase [Acidimicrobiales bacterium]|jgi:sortase A|nr:class E sortase [Acidimicrobiales bacterium]
MSLSRALAAIGRFFIGTGVLVLLFVAYQLWGTGLHEARAQNRLENQFEELLAQHASPGKTTSEALPKTGDDDPTTSTTIAPETTTTTTPLPIVVNEGDAVARLRIPKIGVDKVVVEGVAVSDLRKGPGHYQNTPLPGQPGNAAIAGHRTTYGAPFGDIDQLVPGDQIIVTTTQGTFTYAVMAAPDDPTSGHIVVKPSDVWVLDDAGDNRITLTACHPKYSARQRIVVFATLLDTVTAPTTTTVSAADSTDSDGVVAPPATAEATRPSLDEGLGGDPGARTPAIVWGLVFLLLLAGVWQVSIGWRRWPAYALGSVPLLIVLFFWFEQVDRWLPAR